MAKSSRGGKRSKSGRKPIEDKKVAVCVYIVSSIVNAHGIDTLKRKIVGFVDSLKPNNNQ